MAHPSWHQSASRSPAGLVAPKLVQEAPVSAGARPLLLLLLLLLLPVLVLPPPSLQLLPPVLPLALRLLPCAVAQACSARRPGC